MTVATRKSDPIMVTGVTAAVGEVDIPKTNGTPLSALLSSGIGVFILGVLTTGAVISVDLKNALVLDKAIGPLSGKTVFAVAAYVLAWAVSYFVMRGKNYDARPIFIATFALIAAGFLGTFPIFFDLFAPK